APAGADLDQALARLETQLAADIVAPRALRGGEVVVPCRPIGLRIEAVGAEHQLEEAMRQSIVPARIGPGRREAAVGIAIFEVAPHDGKNRIRCVAELAAIGDPHDLARGALTENVDVALEPRLEEADIAEHQGSPL